jgi:NAD(P)-dependent dehydrogenase (short-subunit alcohol dehydrogenase family)
LKLFDLSGRVALLTGGTRGIGYAAVEALRDAGAAVTFCGEDCEAVVQASSGLGAGVTGITCDVADDVAQQNMLDGVIARHGRLDILVCNAGITGAPGGIATLDLDDYERVMRIDLRAMVVLVRAALPHLASSGGAIVLVSSIAGLRGNAAIGAYSLAKAAVAQLARNIAVEWGPRKVRANAVSPGLIETQLSGALLKNPEFMRRRLQMTPLRRTGTVHEVAGTILWLASPASGFVTGQNIVVDGGTIVTDGN